MTKLTFTDYTNNTTREETIDYDAIGNPLLYRGATLNWYGRQLKTFIKNGTTIAMTYDADGLRSTKQINGVKTEYQYVGDKLFYEKRGDGNSFYYFYDSYGKLSAIYHHVNGNKTAYHVVTNAQGDVIALYDWPGYLVASYEYDAWGNIISVKDANSNAITSQTHIAHLNPFRYRSYYYDKDLGLYYLQSRYYDSEIGRFINADNQLSTADVTGLNLFSYCGNNPVNRVDSTGHAWYHWAIGAAIVAACAVATVATCGGFAAAATAVCMVSSGVAAATTASTIAAGAFIGSATVYGMAALTAAGSSNSVEEFNDQGNWNTVAATALGGLTGGYDGYTMAKEPPLPPTTNPQPTALHSSGVGSPKKNVNPGGSYTKLDNNGNIYSYTQFDDFGRQTMRMDFQGRAHAGILPHTHIYIYPEQGGRSEYIFDMSWHLIN